MRGVCRGALLAFALAGPLAAQQQRPFNEKDYLDLERVGDARISPDGQRVVFSRARIDAMHDRWTSMLWLMDADGGRQRELVEGANPQWSPDGTRIAYLAESGGKPQLWIRYMDAEGLRVQVTRGDQTPRDFRWSPDGRQLAFTMFVPEAPSWTVPMPSAPAGASWAAAPRLVDRLHYRGDRQGFFAPGHVHLFVAGVEGTLPRQITRGDFDVGATFDGQPEGGGFAWTPDARALIFDGDAEADNDRHYLVSNLYAVDVATGARRRLTTDSGYWHAPVVSPDGKWIAFSGFAATGNSYKSEDLWIVRPDGSGARSLTGSFDRDPRTITWADNQTLWFTADDHGTTNIYSVPFAGGAVKPATNGEHAVTLADLSAKGGFGVATRTTPTQPVELVRFSIKKPWDLQPLTHVNDDVTAAIRFGELEEVEYHSGDQLIQGWLIKPPGFTPANKYPLLMEIHGGPHAMYGVAFSPMFQFFAASGYLVFFVNPRGSTGYGTNFGNAIEKAYPGVDYDDLMAGIDEVVKRGWVDTTRMYVGGCSGGGVLASWIVGHNDRFAGAAVRCPVTDWLSFAGQTDVPNFASQFFAKPLWDDPQPYLKSSPLMYVGNVKTPTLLMTGELDLRTPIAQSEEFYVALKRRGVPTALLRFANESHGTTSKPSNWIRTQLYMLSWFEKYRK